MKRFGSEGGRMTIGQWFSFGGRIRRKTFWLGYVLPLFVASVVANILDVALGLTTAPMADAAPADAAQVGPISGLVSLLSIWPMLAGSIKRLHDRDRSGWWIGGFYLVGAVAAAVAFITLAAATGGLFIHRDRAMGPEDAQGVMLVLIVAGLVVAAYGIWLLVETGFLRGTVGPNRFGPDPLGGQGAQWQPGAPPAGWQPQAPPQGWQPQPQWQPPPQQGWQPPPQGWPPAQGQGAPPPGYGAPPPGYGQPPPGYGQPPPGYGQPPPGYGQPPPGPWTGPGQGGSVPPVRRD
ncbi:DUF805 domain-containing protein [Roseomonas sp. CECT 9278]|uniref:DUF805 domain-containing protein n=1 Tax=Roseomonas sp. CECT 9278 TaxID=2845823 RepID=UPI002738898E|nr:DUF805 domain-containing protein [Roseomonas sp. CECT 9278]